MLSQRTPLQAAGKQLERVRQLQTSHNTVAQENERCGGLHSSLPSELTLAVLSAACARSWLRPLPSCEPIRPR